MTPEWINGEGSGSAQLMVIAEAPGEIEEQQGRVLVGPTGKLVNDMLRAAGSSREECYLTNVVKVRPPNNDLRLLKTLGYEINDFVPHLWKEIQLISPNCILALGNLALQVLTGQSGITKWRGSILQSSRGYPKVVPTIHPAALFKKGLKDEGLGKSPWKQKVFIQFDFNRAVAQASFKDFRLPVRNLLVCRNSLDLRSFLDRYKTYSMVDVDVETYKAIPLCIGLAFTRHEGMSCPMFNMMSSNNPTGITEGDMQDIWRLVANLLWNDKIRKIGQNFKFDQTVSWEGIRMLVRGFYADTMMMFHTLYPELPKKLQFVSSIFTEEPYYKDEGREFNPKKDSYERLYLYNAKDACVGMECFEEMDKEMIELSGGLGE